MSSLLLPSLTEFASTTNPIPLSRSRHTVLHRDASETTSEEATESPTSTRSGPSRVPSPEREHLLPSPGGPFLGRLVTRTFKDPEKNIRVERLADVFVRAGLERPEPVRVERSS